ncbi:uncharacterized protein EV154DRAFT_488958 [Mucor mucedo]|uniref:uncharacterized protein n=1 Tax=Mucor mucedo TaxID=29922 RepID=UPI00221E4286|nr:uncharacterized protein EV154DRAFT_488958 [Mucor mucedo]KAI7864152.1 hypothetical protein EV154DRAFT_488958 [Mucor mucedo]
MLVSKVNVSTRSRKRCHLISQGLRMSNIQLPSEEEQSTASPIEERPMAVPRKRMAKENQEGSSSSKKKSYATNPYVDDEASCPDDTPESDRTSVVALVEVPTTSSKEADAIITPTTAIRQNMSILSSQLRLKAIRLLKIPTMTATTEQEDIDKFLKGIFFYDVLGKCIQYVGFYHFFGFLEESKLQGKGLHKKHKQAIKDGQSSKYQTRLLKAAGKRLNVLLKDFKYGALAIPLSDGAGKNSQKFISVIKQDKALTKELQDLQLHSSFLDKTGELNYVYYKDSG